MSVPQPSRPARLGGAVLALTVPAAAAVRTRRAAPAALSSASRVLLVGYVLPGAVLEELIWRAPLTSGARRRRRAAVSMAGFAALHVRRDGIASTPVHLALAAAWTTAALLGRTIVWTSVSHAAYNYLARAGRRQ